MDDKDFEKELDKELDTELDTELDQDYDKDFDYDLYKMKYGIDLRPEPDDDEPIPKRRKAAHAAEKKEDIKARMELYDWLQCIVSAILCGILIFVFIGRVIGVEGTSMLQTLQDQDKVVMSDLLYSPQYGDIVVIKTVAFGDTPIVKRIIATAGHTIDIDFSTGDVKLDGKVIQEKYINERTQKREDFEEPVKVPPGFVFVMGDNRNASTDSRSNYVGLVDSRQILGKVLFVLIPGKGENGDRSWSRVGSVYRG